MGFFKKKLRAEDVYTVLPGVRSKALSASMKKKNLGKVDLKKDMAEFMHAHRHDKFDERRLSKRSIEYK